MAKSTCAHGQNPGWWPTSATTRGSVLQGGPSVARFSLFLFLLVGFFCCWVWFCFFFSFLIFLFFFFFFFVVLFSLSVTRKLSHCLSECYSTCFDVTLNKRTLSLCPRTQFFTEENKDCTHIGNEAPYIVCSGMSHATYIRVPGEGSQLISPHIWSGRLRWVLTFFFSAFYLIPYAFPSPPPDGLGSGWRSRMRTPGAPLTSPGPLSILASS